MAIKLNVVSIKHQLLEKIIKGLKEVKWKDRWDATRLCEELFSFEQTLKPEDLNFEESEAMYLDLLKKEMWSQHPDIIDLYFDAYKPQEVLQMALTEEKKFFEVYGDTINQTNWNSYDVMLTHLGTKLNCNIIF